MTPRAPSSLVASLRPPDDAVLKREERTIVWREVRADGTAVVAKLYRKRGPAWWLRSRLLRFRVEREYRRLQHLRRWEIPCTEPLDWGAGWSTEHGFHELLVMREVPKAVELKEVAGSGSAPLEPLVRLVRRMHESGFCNQTLYASNILVSRDAPPGKGYFIADVPRSWTFPRSLVGTELAWSDLLDLVTELEALGVPSASIPLDAYGLDPAGMAWWAKAAARGDSLTKRRRRVRDLRARIRWAAAWGVEWARRCFGREGRSPER